MDKVFLKYTPRLNCVSQKKYIRKQTDRQTNKNIKRFMVGACQKQIPGISGSVFIIRSFNKYEKLEFFSITTSLSHFFMPKHFCSSRWTLTSNLCETSAYLHLPGVWDLCILTSTWCVRPLHTRIYLVWDLCILTSTWYLKLTQKIGVRTVYKRLTESWVWIFFILKWHQ